MYNLTEDEKKFYIRIIKKSGMGQPDENYCVEKLNSILNEMNSDGIDFNRKDFNEIFIWYELGKPPKELIKDCEKALKKVVPNIDEETLYTMVGFIIRVADAKGGGGGYDEYLSYAKAYFNRKKMEKIIREMIPNKSKEEYYDLYIEFSREFYKDVKDYREKKEFNEFEFRTLE